jgi:precorrin-2 dehydrogenase/sirohydrochlorin ferrochelatase
MSSLQPALFPMFVKLEGRTCLVVGGDAIAESKVQSLLGTGARVRLVAPSITDALAELTRSNSIAWLAREFETADLDGAFLVIAATSDNEVNDRVFREADRRNVLCNAVDQPARCHFYFPAVVRRGQLQVAVSTAGLSPALAQRIRQELEVEFGPEYKEWLERLGRVRTWLMRRGMDFESRSRLLHRLASREAFQRAQIQRSSKRSSQEAAA